MLIGSCSPLGLGSQGTQIPVKRLPAALAVTSPIADQFRLASPEGIRC